MLLAAGDMLGYGWLLLTALTALSSAGMLAGLSEAPLPSGSGVADGGFS